MDSQCEYNKLKTEINISVGKKYMKFIENIVKVNPLDNHSNIHVCKILSRFILPLNIFHWFFNSIKGVDHKLFEHVIKKKLDQDQMIKEVMDLLVVNNFSEISLEQCEPLLSGSGICKNEFQRIFVYELLIGENYSEECDKQKMYPIESISAKYRNLTEELNRGVYEVGFQADYKLLQLIIDQMSKYRMPLKFDPKNNEDHNYLYSWIKENVVKGCNNAEVGGRSEPSETYKIPSKNFEDYLYTLILLEKYVIAKPIMVRFGIYNNPCVMHDA